MAEEFYVAASAKALARLIFRVTQSSPKHFRFSLVGKMQTLTLGVVEGIYQANELPLEKETFHTRQTYQRQVMTDLKLLGFMVELGFETGCLLQKDYLSLVEPLESCRKLVYRWLTSDQKRISPDGD
ncbi:four helix bundle protein [Vagococcus xieshaowenii]|uniref:Four helix bundle protein n=1 Tax=Vagococcus xieshaowenii TaxID=2562451 RepID=A0AAJ5JKX9_9ENTE|nr:four helix bundle protein [Vagococcus xieshaowenii]QCA29462.1 four helix bundle protein [Vagococcus xieshaowenii]TFZ39611.1 four helix bundle protein [Vagococcus xieshaowenii]